MNLRKMSHTWNVKLLVNMIKKLKKYETFILDMDGVLYNGDNQIPGANDTLRRLEKDGKKIVTFNFVRFREY
mgnify:CR=1 FL=1